MEKINTEVIEKLRCLIADSDPQAIYDFIDHYQPIDFAEIVEELDDVEISSLVRLLDDNRLASLMEESDDDERIRIARTLDNRRLMTAFEYMQKDDIVDMLGDFPILRRKEVLRLMKSSDQTIINKLLNYPEDSAGGLMTTDYIALHDDLTVADALDVIRRTGPKTDLIQTIFVIDDKRKLIGTVSLKSLLVASKASLIRALMDDQVLSVNPEIDQEEAARIVARYDLDVIPVVSRSNQILGIITVDDIIDVIIEEYNEDMLQLAGVNVEEKLDSTWRESLRMRLPWLLINLVTAFLASFVVNLFQNTIQQVVALSAVMTIISGMGGNAGTQTMSILVRTLSQKDLSWRDALPHLLKEIVVGVLDGASCGTVTAVIVWFMYHNLYLCLIVVLAMIGNLFVSAVFGFLVPVILKRCNQDPAVASSIFVTTATDTLGFFIFLGLATLMMPYLLR